MTSNGASGGDYQAVEANENRRRRINQVVTQGNDCTVHVCRPFLQTMNLFLES